MKSVQLLLLTALIAFQVSAQINVKADVDSVSSTQYSIYNPAFKAGMFYSDILEARNTTPEELMISIISADNQAWVDYNTKGGSENTDQKGEAHFERVRNRIREKNYFELLSKTTFLYRQKETAIVKFYLHLEENEKPIAGTTVIEKSDNLQWKVASEPSLTSMAMCIMIFKPIVMQNLLSSSPSNSIEEEILSVAYTESGLDFNKLLQIDYTQEEKTYLTNPLNW